MRKEETPCCEQYRGPAYCTGHPRSRVSPQTHKITLSRACLPQPLRMLTGCRSKGVGPDERCAAKLTLPPSPCHPRNSHVASSHRNTREQHDERVMLSNATMDHPSTETGLTLLCRASLGASMSSQQELHPSRPKSDTKLNSLRAEFTSHTDNVHEHALPARPRLCL